MGIIRIDKTDKFTTVSNQPFNDLSLSWEARGVLAYLLTKPNGWVCRNYDIINNGPAGGDKIERILDELQEHGYLTRTRLHKDDGSFDWDSTIHEDPVEVDENTKERLKLKGQRRLEKNKKRLIRHRTIGGESTNGQTTDGKPPHIVNTESVSTELVNTERRIESPKGDNIPIHKEENHLVGHSPNGSYSPADIPIPFIKQESDLDKAFPRPDGYNPPRPRRPIQPIEALVGGYTPSPNPEDTPLIERAQADLQASGWDIRSKDMHHALTYFTAYTPFVVPNSDSERKGWLKYIKVHLDEFGLMSLPSLYRQATGELFDPDKMGEGGYRPPTGPWGYTKTMHGIKAIERIEQPNFNPIPSPLEEGEWQPPYDANGDIIDIFNPPKGYKF